MGLRKSLFHPDGGNDQKQKTLAASSPSVKPMLTLEGWGWYTEGKIKSHVLQSKAALFPTGISICTCPEAVYTAPKLLLSLLPLQCARCLPPLSLQCASLDKVRTGMNLRKGGV